MKKIASLFAAGLCLATVALPASALEPRWGWSDLKTTSWRSAWAELGEEGPAALPALRNIVGPVLPQVQVVALPVDRHSVRAPGALAEVVPVVENAMRSLQSALGRSPALDAELESKGYAPDDVVGMKRSKDGTVTVLVGKPV